MTTFLTPAGYLPHAAPMVLLENVAAVTDSSAHCQVRVTADSVLAPFLDAQGNLPGWFALELMAQTVGVWSGWHRAQHGQSSIALGMVLGARELICAAGAMPGGATLDIQVNLLMQDERFGSFECTISVDEESLATGRVNTFQPSPEELHSLFSQEKSV